MGFYLWLDDDLAWAQGTYEYRPMGTAVIAASDLFRRRDFDLVTVSTNYPDEKTGVLKILQSQHASSRNLQFASEDTYAMQAAFDAKWNSGVPFTMVLAPGGKVIYQKEGELDILELRRIVLANLPDPDYIGHRAYWGSK